MKALVNGERNGSVGTVLSLAALIALLAGSLFLTLAYRGQLVALKHVIYTRCNDRIGYDQANHASVGADVTYLRSQLAETLRQRPAAQVLIDAFPSAQRPALREAERHGIADLRTALAAKERAYAAGVIGSCRKFR